MTSTWEEKTSKFECAPCSHVGKWYCGNQTLSNLLCSNCNSSMLTSYLLLEDWGAPQDAADDGPSAPSEPAAASSEMQVGLVAGSVSHSFPFAPTSPAELCASSSDAHYQGIWVAIEVLDITFDDDVDQPPALVSTCKTVLHPRRRKLEATMLMMRQAPKVTLQALPADAEDTKFYLNLDTGCQRTVVGFGWLGQGRAELLKRLSCHCDVFTEHRRFPFGSGGPEMFLKCKFYQ